MNYNKCYFCNQSIYIVENHILLSCKKHCFTKAHTHCFNKYEKDLVSLIRYPGYYSYNYQLELMWNIDFKLISNRLPCNCKNKCCFKPHQDNQQSLFYYGTNFNFAQHELNNKN